MRRVLCLGASLALLSTAENARAATFTPDMWVYEITLTAKALGLDTTSFHAHATTNSVAGGLPAGCDVFPLSSEHMDVYCNDPFELPGGDIDLLATIDPSFAPTRTVRIGFNASQVVCDAGLVAGCPVDGKNSEGAPSFGGPSFFTDVVLDAVSGKLS